VEEIQQFDANGNMATWPRSCYGRSRCRPKRWRSFAAVVSRPSESSMFTSTPETKQSWVMSPRLDRRGRGGEKNGEQAQAPTDTRVAPGSPVWSEDAGRKALSDTRGRKG
jgi:hypothetical protein